eukprot:gene6423-4629_t
MWELTRNYTCTEIITRKLRLRSHMSQVLRQSTLHKGISSVCSCVHMIDNIKTERGIISQKVVLGVSTQTPFFRLIQISFLFTTISNICFLSSFLLFSLGVLVLLMGPKATNLSIPFF